MEILEAEKKLKRFTEDNICIEFNTLREAIEIILEDRDRAINGFNCLNKFVEEKYISKDKIREKINELEEQIEEVRKNISNSTDEEKTYWRKEKRDLVLQKFILKELLEE